MPRTMKAAVVHKLGKPLVIEEVPVPEPGHGQILVKVAAARVCHTDLHAVEGDWPVKPKPPFIPGHEGVGHVFAAGAGVKHGEGGRPRRRAVAVHRLRSLQALPRRLGNAVRGAAEHRLLGEWRSPERGMRAGQSKDRFVVRGMMSATLQEFDAHDRLQKWKRSSDVPVGHGVADMAPFRERL